MRPAYWLPPCVWMGVILWFSSDAWSAAETGRLILPIFRWVLPWMAPGELDAVHHLARKGGHVTEYALLAALWFRAFARGGGLGARASAWPALLISLGWAFLDELFQSTLLTRTGSAADVALDGAGALAALAALRAGWRASVDAVTGALLWVALLGGGTALAVNRWAGVSSGILWSTTVLAALGLLARRRLRR